MNRQAMYMAGRQEPNKAAGKVLAVSLLVLLVPCAYGQTTPATQPPVTQPVVQTAPIAQKVTTPASTPATPVTKEKTTTLIVNSDEVSLDLVVHNKKKKLVLDLQPADITVTDNGTPVTLHDLHLVSGNSQKSHLVTLVFDPMVGVTGVNAQSIADKILKMLPKTGFRVAVLSLGSRLRLIQGFTSDSGALEQAVQLATEEGDVQRGMAIAVAEKNLAVVSNTGVDGSGKMVSLQERSLAQTLLASLEGSQRILQDQHTRPSLAGLLALARAQQSLEERKTVIYFTVSGQLDTDAVQMVHTIMGAANRANVSMYTVDMTGIGAGTRDQLMSMIAMGPISGVNPMAGQLPHGIPSSAAPGGPAPTGPHGSPLGPTQGDMGEGVGTGNFIVENSTSLAAQGEGDGIANSSPLGKLAASTGGAYIDGQDSVKKPLTQMLLDMTTYYQASYTPPAQEYDGSFRAIAIKPVRAGLVVRSKTGYFSLPSGGVEGIRPFEAPLLRILSDSQLPTDLKFHASVLRLGNLPDGNTNSLVIEVPLSELEVHEDSNTNLYSAHASIVAQIKDKNGTVIERFGEDIPRHGALESVEQAKSETITLQRHFIAVPGDYFLETAVMDRNSESAGAQRIHFTVPEPAAGPSLSDVVLVRRMDTYRAEADSDEPLRFEDGKVTPNLSGQVTRNAKSVSFFFILHPDPTIAEKPTLEMEVLRDGSAAGHTSLPFHPGSGQGAIPYLAALQTSSLPPGFYDVKARMTQGGKNVDSDIAFTVEGSQPDGAAPGSAVADAVDAKLPEPGTEPRNASQLVITVPDKAVPPPSPEEMQSILDDARQNAVRYSDGLPNFLCAEVTNRSVDSSGTGRWKHKDSEVELLQYRDHSETRTMLQVDGKPVSADRAGMKGTFSSGEFGGVLNAVFQASSKADFKWKETDTLGTGTVQVLNYSVAHDNSSFKVTSADNRQVTAAMHGQVFIDGATRTVRRVTLTADDLPVDFPIHATSIAVDYDYVVINAHDYLMPIAGELVVKQGRRQAILNQFELRDFRHFGSTATILGFTPVETP